MGRRRPGGVAAGTAPAGSGRAGSAPPGFACNGEAPDERAGPRSEADCWVTAHGLQTYVASLDSVWHLRLDGLYDSFDNGAGVAYHPRAKSTLSANPDRVLFTVSAQRPTTWRLGTLDVYDGTA